MLKTGQQAPKFTLQAMDGSEKKRTALYSRLNQWMWSGVAPGTKFALKTLGVVPLAAGLHTMKLTNREPVYIGRAHG